MMRKLRRALLALLIVCAVLAGLVLGGSGWVVWQGRDRVLSEEDAPGAPFDCILVLGCGVYADGTPTPMLNDRIHTGAALYAHGWSGTVLMSGDNRAEDYNEVGTMTTVAEGLGVPVEAIVCEAVERWRDEHDKADADAEAEEVDEPQSDVKSEMSDVYETVEIANVESHAKIKPPELQKTAGDASMARRQQEAAQTFTEITEEIERFLRRNHSGRGSFTAQV